MRLRMRRQAVGASALPGDLRVVQEDPGTLVSLRRATGPTVGQRCFAPWVRFTWTGRVRAVASGQKRRGPTVLALAPLKLAADPGPDSRFPLRGGTVQLANASVGRRAADEPAKRHRMTRLFVPTVAGPGARRRLSTSREDSWTGPLAIEPAGARRDVVARNGLPLAA
jgi:hypothetical protein